MINAIFSKKKNTNFLLKKIPKLNEYIDENYALKRTFNSKRNKKMKFLFELKPPVK